MEKLIAEGKSFEEVRFLMNERMRSVEYNSISALAAMLSLKEAPSDRLSGIDADRQASEFQRQMRVLEKRLSETSHIEGRLREADRAINAYHRRNERSSVGGLYSMRQDILNKQRQEDARLSKQIESLKPRSFAQERIDAITQDEAEKRQSLESDRALTMYIVVGGSKYLISGADAITAKDRENVEIQFFDGIVDGQSVSCNYKEIVIEYRISPIAGCLVNEIIH
ncbi:MAG: hypothetical protein WKF34_07375 [Pyrinomonadaceae bacterium]